MTITRHNEEKDDELQSVLVAVFRAFTLYYK